MEIKDWNETNNSNSSIDGINIAENCAFSSMNDMGRAIMGAVRREIAAAGSTVTAATLATISGASQFKVLTGGTTISAFDTAVTGLYREMVAGSTLILAPTTALGLHHYSANISLEPGALVKARSLGAGNWATFPERANGLPVVTPPTSLGRHALWVSAAGMRGTVTNGAAADFVAADGSSPDVSCLRFDQTTQEFAVFQLAMPKSWNEGTVTFKAYWWANAATGGVVWAMDAVAFSDGDAFGTAFGTAQTSTDSAASTDILYVSPESSAITIAGSPAAEDFVVFRIKRVPANGSDTLADDAYLLGVTIYVTTDAGTDV